MNDLQAVAKALTETFSRRSLMRGLLGGVITLAGTNGDVNAQRRRRKRRRRFEAKVVGGRNAKRRLPVAAIVDTKRRGKNITCGATVLDELHLLTAAHCARVFTFSKAQYQPRVGCLNYGSKTCVPRRITKIAIHPGYNPKTVANDVAVLRLNKPLPASVLRARLPEAEDLSLERPGSFITIAGWGEQFPQSPNGSSRSRMTRHLQVARVRVLSEGECRKRYRGSGAKYHTDSSLCATAPRTDTCYGDSGGSGLVWDGKNWVVVAVVSWGIGCAQKPYPGVYSQVRANLPFIRNAMRT